MSCSNCSHQLKPNAVFCGSCGTAATSTSPPQENLTANDVANFAKDRIKKVKNQINDMTGSSRDYEIKLKDVFSDVFKKHTREESDAIFIAGSIFTTPKESEMTSTWPKPWLFSRIFVFFLISIAFLYVSLELFRNINILPGQLIMASFAVPFTCIIFFFETNAPRNISFSEVLKIFFIGGTASLLSALILFDIFYPQGGSPWLATLAGPIEETAKILIVAFFVRKANTKYILNGLLIGATVGAGFAAFETAGFGLRFFMLSSGNISVMNDVLILRGWMAIGAHVVWTAISGAALIMVKQDQRLSTKHFFDMKFIRLFLVSVVLHAIWNSPIDFPFDFLVQFRLKFIILIIVAWLFVFPLINAGLKQVSEISAKARM